MIHRATFLLLLAACMVPGGEAALAPAHPVSPLTPADLRCEHSTDPLGLDVSQPRLSWKLQTARPEDRGQRQTAYRILVATTAEKLSKNHGDIWDSGRVPSDQSVLIDYAGQPLRSHRLCHWKVMAWDRDGKPTAWSAPARWSMGVLAPDKFSARWIGVGTSGGDWSDYTLETTFTIAREAASIYFRAHGADAYLWQINTSGASAVFKPHVRAGGGFRVLKVVPLPGFSTDSNSRHTLRITAVGDRIETWLDGKSIDVTHDTTYKTGGVGFRDSATETTVFHRLTVTAPSGQILFEDRFNAGEPNRFSGGTIGSDGLTLTNGDAFLSNSLRTPLLRRGFTVSKPVRRAWVYASALGIYELHLNGARVGDGLLSPGWTDYRKQAPYETFDVTVLLHAGPNAIGAQLAPGWYAGNIGWFGPNQYGDTPRLFAELHLEYADGTTATVGTDTAWRASEGPLVFADNLDGETYDARREQAGWDRAGFDDAGWQPVSATDLPEGSRLVARIDPPVRVTQELRPVATHQLRPGVYVYDLGQDISGVARLRLRGKAGATVTIRYAEAVHADGTLNAITLNSPGIPGAFARATDSYTFARDGIAVFEPRFTWHGFRYIEVSGAESTPEVTGRAMGTDVPHVGGLVTSSDLLNKIQNALQWSGRDAFMSIPMDCPQRTERIGWTGDANFYLHTAAFNFDMARFYRKWERDIVVGQSPQGQFSNVAPSWGPPGDGGYGGGWGDAGVCVPWAIYRAGGDLGIVRENFPALQRYIDCLREISTGLILPESAAPAGDWQNDHDDTPHSLIATAYFAYDVDLMARMAEALGKSEDATRYRTLFAAIGSAFTARFVSADGVVATGSQTACILALHLRLVPDALRQTIGDRLILSIRGRGNRLSTGFVGTQWLLPTLTEIGRSDLAYLVLQQTEKPSWGYMVGCGSTTIWENWGVMNRDGTINGGANSLNHCALGSCGDWMYENIGGIAPDPAAPGYKHILIRPAFGEGLTSAHAWHDSPYGRIEVNWKFRPEGGFTLDITVPVNTMATVTLPSHLAAGLTEGERWIGFPGGLPAVRRNADYTEITVGSGMYHFVRRPACSPTWTPCSLLPSYRSS